MIRVDEPPEIDNGDFDIDYVSPALFVPRVIWNDQHWNSLRLREEILKGEWITEKKEKKHMFFKKLWKAINKIEERVQSQGKIIVGDGVHNSSNPGLSSQLWDLEAKTEVEYIDCHTCGCVVRKEIAFRSNDHTVLEIYLTLKPDESSTHEEVVHETWYCKLHKKGKKAYGSE